MYIRPLGFRMFFDVKRLRVADGQFHVARKLPSRQELGKRKTFFVRLRNKLFGIGEFRSDSVHRRLFRFDRRIVLSFVRAQNISKCSVHTHLTIDRDLSPPYRKDE